MKNHCLSNTEISCSRLSTKPDPGECLNNPCPKCKAGMSQSPERFRGWKQLCSITKIALFSLQLSYYTNLIQKKTFQSNPNLLSSRFLWVGGGKLNEHVSPRVGFLIVRRGRGQSWGGVSPSEQVWTCPGGGHMGLIPLNGRHDTTENITIPQLHWRMVKNAERVQLNKCTCTNYSNKESLNRGSHKYGGTFS